MSKRQETEQKLRELRDACRTARGPAQLIPLLTREVLQAAKFTVTSDTARALLAQRSGDDGVELELRVSRQNQHIAGSIGRRPPRATPRSKLVTLVQAALSENMDYSPAVNRCHFEEANWTELVRLI